MNDLHTIITRIALVAVGLLGLAGAQGLQAQEEGPGETCWTCVNVDDPEGRCVQTCEETAPREDGFNGADCDVHYYKPWRCSVCMWTGPCGVAEEEDLAMLVSPAGTVVDRNAGSLRSSGGYLAVTCNGLVVTHLDDGRRRSEAITLLAL